MGLLDALFSNDSGGGMLGGLPQSWQYKNPQDEIDQKNFLAGLSQDPMNGTGYSPPPQSPFGPVPAMAPAPGVFNAGAAPVMGASGLSPPMFAQAPQAAAPAPVGPPAPAMAAPAPQIEQPAGPINNMDIGGYSMPQFGSVADYTPQRAAPAPAAPSTDISAQSRTAPPPPPFGQPSDGVAGNALTGLQSFLNGGGLISSIRAASNGQRSDPAGIQQQNQRQQYQALTAVFKESGKTPQQASQLAMLALTNPEAAKTLVSEALTSKEKWGEIGSDSFGNKTMGWINERDQTINGKEMGADGGGTGGAGAASGFMAPGVKSVDSSLTGKDYLKQFSPEVQAAVQNYVDGKSMPTGNPRKGFTQAVKMIAQKYGSDTGQPVDDVTYGERRTMRNQLALSSNSSMGGILSNGESSFKHLAEYIKSAADQGNVSHNFPLGGAIAHAQNYVTNAGGGSDTQGKVKAINDNLGKYGAESTKFYAGTGGGVEERLNALKEMNGNTTSGEEAAAYAEKEKSLMLDRLNTKLQEIRNTLGETEGNRIIAKHMPDIQKNVEAIDANIARIKSPASAAPASAGIPSGWSVKVR